MNEKQMALAFIDKIEAGLMDGMKHATNQSSAGSLFAFVILARSIKDALKTLPE